MDDLTLEQRRENMWHIRLQDIKVEVLLRRSIRKKGTDSERIIKNCLKSRILYLLNIK